jgi:hypothetical protein
MAQGVEGRFDRPSEATWDPSVAGAGIEGALRGVGAVAAPIGRALKRKYDDNKATNERLKKADYDVGLTIDLKRGLSDMESVRLGTKKAKPMLALPAAKTPFDRQAQKISMTESMGRSQFGPLREPTGGVIPMGPVIETTATPSKPATSRTQSREWLSDPERARQAGSRSNIPLIWR